MVASMLALTPEAQSASGAGASTDTTTTKTARSAAELAGSVLAGPYRDALDALRHGFGDDLTVIDHREHRIDPGDGLPGETSTRPLHRARRDANTAFARITGRAVCDYDPGPVYKPEAQREREHALRHDHTHDYDDWLSHVAPAAACTHPIQLRGTSHTVDGSTGEVLSSRSTGDMPDGVIYKACGNRRATVCPSCAETYRADTYQLIKAGLVGGKGVPESVNKHVAAFVTFTAPSFGIVHTRPGRKGEPAKPCRPRRKPVLCPHGIDMRCFTKHRKGEKSLGKPLCLDCYDYDGQVVWNVMTGELWRRTTDKIATTVRTWSRDHEIRARVSYAKVAEMQARGAAHFHALFRLDGINPDDPDAIVPPCGHATIDLLVNAIRSAVASTSFTTLPHPDRDDGWTIGWGPQLDLRPVHLTADGAVTETQVAAYLAKYSTKATEDAGHASARITPDTIAQHTDGDDGHVPRIIDACWNLGRPGCDLDPTQAAKNSGRLSYSRLRRWAHMLGFGGHFSTKSRRYSTTLRILREARMVWRRQHHRTTEHLDADPETTLIVGDFVYAGTGWHTTGDALLANTAAAKAREHRHTAKEEHAHLEALDLT